MMVRPDAGGRAGGGAAPGGGSEPVGELVKQAAEQMAQLVRQEMALAVAEVKDKGRHAGIGAGMVGVAGMVGAYGGAAVLVAVIAVLALVLPVWGSALIVGAVLLAVAGVLGLKGRSQISRALPPVPEQAIQGARRDVAQIKERAQR
ncbi:MAG: hypothetical protein JWN00_1889 [Actinomycetia bacterium]|nr:hypothetical protein [Actinomycetes bacterium]